MKFIKRRLAQRAVAILLFSGLSLNVMMATGAHAESGYRYWSFWINDGTSWSMAQEGAGTLIPHDGDVQGWRFISAPETAGPEFAPRSIATFEEVCGTTSAETGKVRIALTVDFGDVSDYSTSTEIPALESSCVLLNEGDPSSLALSSVYEVREENGLVCGVEQLPATGCGETVEISPNQRAVTMAAPASDTTEQPQEDDRLPQIVSIILGTVVFVMAWRRMQWQKQNKQK